MIMKRSLVIPLLIALLMLLVVLTDGPARRAAQPVATAGASARAMRTGPVQSARAGRTPDLQGGTLPPASEQEQPSSLFVGLLDFLPADARARALAAIAPFRARISQAAARYRADEIGGIEFNQIFADAERAAAESLMKQFTHDQAAAFLTGLIPALSLWQQTDPAITTAERASIMQAMFDDYLTSHDPSMANADVVEVHQEVLNEAMNTLPPDRLQQFQRCLDPEYATVLEFARVQRLDQAQADFIHDHRAQIAAQEKALRARGAEEAVVQEEMRLLAGEHQAQLQARLPAAALAALSQHPLMGVFVYP